MAPETQQDTESEASDAERLVSCRHTTTRGRAGENGSWCVECGEKVYDVEERECQDCQSFFRTINYTGCNTHLMAVSPDMRVTYKIENGTCWKGS